MNLDRFIRDRQDSWAELRGLVTSAKGRAERLGPDGVRRLGALYRAAAADLALARRRFALDPSVAMLEDLVGRARHLVYAGEVKRESVRDFFARRYWQRVAERPVLLLLAALLLFSPVVLGTVWGMTDPATAGGIVPGALSGGGGGQGDADLGFTTAESAQFSAEIFTNNIRVSFLALAGGITGGVLTAFSMLFNGLVLGVITGISIEVGTSDRLIQLVVPTACSSCRASSSQAQPGCGSRRR